jgi:hypothetical protein
MVLKVGTAFLDCAQAMMGSLIAELDTLAQDFEVPVVFVTLMVGSGGAAA